MKRAPLFLVFALSLTLSPAFALPTETPGTPQNTQTDPQKAKELPDTGEELKAIQALIDAKDYTNAVKRLKPLAAQENPEALYVLGYLTQEGRGF